MVGESGRFLAREVGVDDGDDDLGVVTDLLERCRVEPVADKPGEAVSAICCRVRCFFRSRNPGAATAASTEVPPIP